MPVLIDPNRTIKDDWLRLDDARAPRSGRVLVSAERLLREIGKLQRDKLKLGVEIDPDYDVVQISQYLPRISLVVLQFEDFADGRAFSQASLLRQRYAFAGHIRARGQVLSDQLAFMLRCGFDQFELAAEQDVGLALRAFGEISHSYQTEICAVSSR